MTSGDLIVAAVIVLLVVGAVAWLVYSKKKGKSSCGCDCSACKGCGKSNVDIDECNCCAGKK